MTVMLKAGLQRIIAMDLSLVWWVLLFLPDAVQALPVSALGDFLTQAWPFRILVTLLNCLVIVALFKATRSLGGAAQDGHGAFGAWLGWTLVAYIPALVIALVITAFAPFFQTALPQPTGDFTIRLGGDTIILALTLIGMAPYLLHSAGCAISAGARPLAWSQAICSGQFPKIGLAIAVAYALPRFGGDVVLAIGRWADGFAVPAAILAAVLSQFSVLWSVAVAVTAWLSCNDPVPNVTGNHSEGTKP